MHEQTVAGSPPSGVLGVLQSGSQGQSASQESSVSHGQADNPASGVRAGQRRGGRHTEPETPDTASQHQPLGHADTSVQPRVHKPRAAEGSGAQMSDSAGSHSPAFAQAPPIGDDASAST